MKRIYMSAALVFSALFVVGKSYAENESPVLAYFGESDQRFRSYPITC